MADRKRKFNGKYYSFYGQYLTKLDGQIDRDMKKERGYMTRLVSTGKASHPYALYIRIK